MFGFLVWNTVKYENVNCLSYLVILFPCNVAFQRYLLEDKLPICWSFFFSFFFFSVVLGLHCGTWHAGFSSCAWAPWFPSIMWDLSSLTRDQTLVPYIGRRILNHWATRQVLQLVMLCLKELTLCFLSLLTHLNCCTRQYQFTVSEMY